MTNEEQRIIGGLAQSVEDLRRQAEINRQENRSDFDKVFSQLSTLQTTGCAVGAKNADEIKTLKGRPERALSVGAIVMAGIVATVELFKHLSGK